MFLPNLALASSAGAFLCRNNRQSAWVRGKERCPMPETARQIFLASSSLLELESDQ
jgi:hypothetical protein